MPATLAQPVIIGIDRASGPELGVITFICGDCERTEHTQYCVLPEGWDSEVYSWLSDNDPNQLENRDDQGGWPDEESLRVAFTALGYKEQE